MAQSKVITATGLAVSGAGVLIGFVVASHTSGTVKLEDSVGGGQNLLLNTYTLAVGSQIITLPAPIVFTNGLYITLGGSALSISLIIA